MPLADLLDYVEGEVWRSDSTEAAMMEMARRLRKLDKAVAGWQVSHGHIADGLHSILEGKK